MTDSKSEVASPLAAIAKQRGVWFIGLFLAMLSMRTAVSAANSTPPAPAANGAQAGGALPGGSASAAPPPPALLGIAAGCKDQQSGCCEGWKLIEEYRALYEVRDTDGSPPDAGPGGVQFRHLIATVPDPLESGHGDYFDGVLEGVEEAVAEGSNGVTYVRDRSWLPWSGNDAAKKALHCWDTQPGVLVYRSTDNPGDPRHPGRSAIIVLLVGETPTWGLRTKQFETALELVEGAHAFGSGNPAEYKVLGPTFSGTAASLSAVIRRQVAKAPSERRFSIVSGSATGPSVKQTLEMAGIAEPFTEECEPHALNQRRVCYASTTPTDDLLLRGMLDFIGKTGGECPPGKERTPECNIVLLTESLTAYGAGSAKSPKGSRENTVREIKFPPNLSALRRAYDGVRTTAGAGLPPTRAPLGIEGPLKGSEEELSGDTASSHDLALGQVLRDLSRSGVRFVGIVATDARDVLFLAQRIRAQLPDIRLFTLGSDIRYLHPDYAQFVDGMLVAHSALVLGEDGATSFRVELVRNVFLAGRQLLGNGAHLPMVSISMIGNGALWQISDDRAKEAKSDEAATETTPDAPISWTFVYALFLVGFLALRALVWAPAIGEWWVGKKVERRERSNGFLRRRGFLWAMVGPCEHADLAGDDRVVTSAFLSVAAGPVLLMSVAWFAREGTRTNLPKSVACAVTALGAIALLWFFRPGKATSEEAKPSLSAVVVSSAATLGTVFALGLGCGPQRAATFNLLSGGSPVLVGLAGLTIFGLSLWSWRVRLRFLDTHRFGVSRKGRLFSEIEPPIAQALGETRTGSASGLAEVERRFLAILRNPWLSFSVVPVVVHVALLVSLVVVFLTKAPRTLEPGPRNWLLVAFGIVSLLPVTGTFSCLVAGWIVFARLLRRLAPHCATAALRRLPDRLARPLDAQLTISTNEADDLAYPVRALAELAALCPDLEGQFRTCADLLNDELKYEAGPSRDSKESKELDPADPLRPRATNPAEHLQPSDRCGRLVECLLETSGRVSASRPFMVGRVPAKADDFVASLIAVFIPRYVRHFGLFVPPLILGSMLSTLMTSLYFVQPQRLITSMIFIWVAGMVVAIFFIGLALERDPVISAMGKTTAGSVELSWGLVRRVTSWGVLPLASMVASQYPEFASRVASLFEVITKGFR